MNKVAGFYDECASRFPPAQGARMWSVLNRVLQVHCGVRIRARLMVGVKVGRVVQVCMRTSWRSVRFYSGVTVRCGSGYQWLRWWVAACSAATAAPGESRR